MYKVRVLKKEVAYYDELVAGLEKLGFVSIDKKYHTITMYTSKKENSEKAMELARKYSKRNMASELYVR